MALSALQVRWARCLAHELLAISLPRRWAHTRGVAARAASLATILGSDAQLLEAAAWLHDIGYSPGLAVTGFHPLDGARYLRDSAKAHPLLCRLVAYHSCAEVEADERGLALPLRAEFEPPPADLVDALTYCDMTTSPDGIPITVADRLTEILTRYGDGHVVSRSVTRAAPRLTEATDTIARRLAQSRRSRYPNPDKSVFQSSSR